MHTLGAVMVNMVLSSNKTVANRFLGDIRDVNAEILKIK